MDPMERSGTIKGDKAIQQPVVELSSLGGESVRISTFQCDGDGSSSLLQGEAFSDPPRVHGKSNAYSQSQSQARSQSQSHSTSHLKSQSQSPSAFDYTLPRRLHDSKHSPPMLSTLDEPIRRVVEDMREQRMSLCQSLRQYVFVHRTVIEGALQLVDEERKAYGDAWMDVDVESGASGGQSSSSSQAALGDAGILGASPGKGKRRPSPTELPKEDKKGELRLAKRPSLKRPHRSSDEDDAGLFAKTQGEEAK
jgi:hypothetical protein